MENGMGIGKSFRMFAKLDDGVIEKRYMDFFKIDMYNI